MKKYVVLLALVISFSILKSQTCLNLNLKILNKAVSEKKMSGFTNVDSLTTWYGTIMGSYKDKSGSDLVFVFDSLNKYQKVLNLKEDITTPYEKYNKRLIYHENDYIKVLYVELPAYNVTLSLTSSFTTKEILENFYTEFNPEELLKKAVVK